MNRLLFLLPFLFLACGTQPKTVNTALQTEEEKPAAIMPAKEEEKPAAITPTKEEMAEKRPAEKEPDKQAQTEIALVAVGTRNSGGFEDESYEEIFNEVQYFIKNLNNVIERRDYKKWNSVLSEELRMKISSTEFLKRMSETPSMRSMKRVLKGPEDYFFYVVVPSRAYSQVDKIEIIDNNRVRALFINTKKERTELVYELAKTGDSWTIIQ